VSFSYDDNLADAVSRIRFAISDKTEPAKFSNEEITAQLALCGADETETAAKLCDSLAAEYSQRPDEKVGGVDVKWSQLASQYLALAAAIRETASTSSVPAPWAGGISVAEIEESTLDTTITQPNFVIGAMDNVNGAMDNVNGSEN